MLLEQDFGSFGRKTSQIASPAKIARVETKSSQLLLRRTEKTRMETPKCVARYGKYL